MATVIGRGYNGGISSAPTVSSPGISDNPGSPYIERSNSIQGSSFGDPSGLASGLAHLAGSDASLLGEIIRNANDYPARNSALSQELAERQMEYQRDSDTYAMNWSAQEAAKNREWQERMSDTAHQREVKDLIAAGLNPILSANHGATTPAGSSGQAFTSSGAMGQVDTTNPLNLLQGFFSDILNSAMTMRLHTDQMNLEAQRLATNERIAHTQANANIIASENSAAAAAYSADQHLAGVQAQNEANKLITELNIGESQRKQYADQDWQSIEKQNQREHEKDQQMRGLVSTASGLSWVLGSGFGNIISGDKEAAQRFARTYFGDMYE